MTTDDEGLKPCPFCGGKAELRKGDESAYVQCLAVSGHTAIYLSGDNAIAGEVVRMWNRRDNRNAGDPS